MTMTEAVLSAVSARGLDVELASKLGWASEHRNGIEYLAIPCLREGKLHRTKMRTLTGDKKFLQEGAGPIPWNEDCLRDPELRGKLLVITEGELDALAAMQAGFTRVMSVPDGAPQTAADAPADQKRYAWVHELRALLTRDLVPEIILAVDGDEPGRALLQDLSVMLGRFRCRFITYPLSKTGERLKDLNDVLLAYGTNGVLQTLSRAAWIKVEGVYRMAQLPERPNPKPLGAGWPMMDENYRVRMGDFAVVTGIPSHGKSAWANDFYCSVADRHKLRVAWASFEQAPTTDHRRALRAWHSGSPEHQMLPDQMAAADAWINDFHRFIVPDEDDDVTLEWMVEKVEQAVVQHGCKIIVIDPWNEMDHDRAQGETETEYTGRAIKRLRRLARAFAVHLVVIAHPQKLRKDDTGATPAPNLYDVSGSAHWHNKADVGVVVHRQTPDLTYVMIAKSRYHQQIGRTGTVAMTFNPASARFREIERIA